MTFTKDLRDHLASEVDRLQRILSQDGDPAAIMEEAAAIVRDAASILDGKLPLLVDPSPIEQRFASGLVDNWLMRVKWMDLDTIEQFSNWVKRGNHAVDCLAAHQIWVEPYCVDFMLGILNPETNLPLLIAVECDGHDFHEKTKEQAAHDKKRDRFLVSQGIIVMRFTGSEIWADPLQCANEVTRILMNASMPELAGGGVSAKP